MDEEDLQVLHKRLYEKLSLLAGARRFNDIRHIYWVLHTEILITSLIHSPPAGSAQILFGDHPNHWLRLRLKDVPVLRQLTETTWNQYRSESFRDKMLSIAREHYLGESGDPIAQKERYKGNYKQSVFNFLDRIANTAGYELTDEDRALMDHNSFKARRSDYFREKEFPQKFEYLYKELRGKGVLSIEDFCSCLQWNPEHFRQVRGAFSDFVRKTTKGNKVSVSERLINEGDPKTEGVIVLE
jgi:hypothetical protein